jgi:hypothetical protein
LTLGKHSGPVGNQKPEELVGFGFERERAPRAELPPLFIQREVPKQPRHAPLLVKEVMKTSRLPEDFEMLGIYLR